ncbi:hypothetical protein BSL78_28786 [Apostichopus japonicus]|uniref:Rab-GAP TBC domain-containing protein n=1 Tax=Stichopus japonicus TaxID=307972 RepID=A0A2G8JF57_STIJA|nr:hypothetical protein BSL78_28786 [Apostichopus japonicus]
MVTFISRNDIATSTSTINHQKLLWEKFLRGWPESHMKHPGRLRCLLKRGVPPEMRRDVWRALLGCEQLRSTSSLSYQEYFRPIRLQLVELGISEYSLNIHNHELWEAGNGNENALKTLREIIVDVDRTFPTHRLFMGRDTSAKEGQASLFRLLSAYSIYNSEVGYCQGMSYIAGMLLMQMASEEESFWAMVALFEKPKYLSGYFDSSLQRIQNHSAIFQKLLLQRYPKLGKHFILLDVNPLMFVTPWFMCLFTSMPCWETVLAIWDLLLLDGISTIFRVALGILHLDRLRCLSCDEMGQVLPKLLHPPAQLVELTTFMPVVWKMTVDKWEIESLQAIVEEEAEKPGSKRSRRSIEAAKVKRQKTVSEEDQPQSFLQKVRNVLNPLGQRILQDASNIVAPPPPEVTSQISPGSGTSPRGLKVHKRRWLSRTENPSERKVTLRNSPRVTIVTRDVQPGRRRMDKDNSLENPVYRRRRKGSRLTSQLPTGSEKAPSSSEMTQVTRIVKATQAVKKRSVPKFIPNPAPNRRTPVGASKLVTLVLVTQSLQKMLKRSARAQHSFKTFHTPTPLRKSQVKGHLVISPHNCSPEELQQVKISLTKDLEEA